MRGQPGRNGRFFSRMAAVLRPDFPLHDCVVCGNPILPWRRNDVGPSGPFVRWCTPSEYKRRKACGPDCGARVQEGAATGSGLWVGMGEIRRGQHLEMRRGR